VKGQKNEILTRQESRPGVFHFLPNAHFLKQLPTHIAHIAKGIEKGLNRFDEDRNFVIYIHQNKKRNYNNL